MERTSMEDGMISPLMNELELLDTEIYSYLGYREALPDEYARVLIDCLKEEAISLCQPKLGFKIVTGEIVGKKSIQLIDDKLIHPEAIITHSLKGSECFAIIVASVGKEMDDWISTKRQGDDIMHAFVADALGSTIVESIVAWGVNYLERKVADWQMQVSNPYSPGYCGWDIAEQRILFSLLPTAFCGVTLTESCLMLPIKSVSAVVGIGSTMKKRPYKCALCTKKDCYKRKVC